MNICIILLFLLCSILLYFMCYKKYTHNTKNKYSKVIREEFRTCMIRDEKLNQIRDKLIQLHPKASSMSFCIDDQETYTEDKFKTYMCLKDKDGNYYPDNMLMYVAIHELAHAISKQVDPNHKTQEFHQNFNYLLNKAKELGIYDPSIPPIEEYCNIKKNNNLYN